jgi:hypothetical protein
MALAFPVYAVGGPEKRAAAVTTRVKAAWPGVGSTTVPDDFHVAGYRASASVRQVVLGSRPGEIEKIVPFG